MLGLAGFTCKCNELIILQESFEIPRGQRSRAGDVEMGMSSGDLGLESFFKKVLFYYLSLVMLLVVHYILCP